MGNRYVVSGVQLGMIKALAEQGDSDGVKKLTNDITEHQWYKDSENHVLVDVDSLRSEFFDFGN